MMEGLITITGKMIAGYDVTVRLPCEFLDKFVATTGNAVADEFLCPSWGRACKAKIGQKNVREIVKSFAKLAQAYAAVEQCREMILDALEAESKPGLMETIRISLD